MQAETTIYFVIWWVLFKYSSFRHFSKFSRGFHRVFTYCSSRNNPYPPQGRSLEIPRGRGVLKAKILETKYGAKLKFLGEAGGAKQKTRVHEGMAGVWIFLEMHMVIHTSFHRNVKYHVKYHVK